MFSLTPKYTFADYSCYDQDDNQDQDNLEISGQDQDYFQQLENNNLDQQKDNPDLDNFDYPELSDELESPSTFAMHYLPSFESMSRARTKINLDDEE